MSRISSDRGSVLLHVLMTGALLAIIAATILRLAMLRYTITARTTEVNQERRYNETAMSLLTTQWNSTGMFCSSVPGYYSCNLFGGAGSAPPLTSCSCSCRPIGAVVKTFPYVDNANASPPCQFKILANPNTYP